MKARIMLNGRDKSVERRIASLRHQQLSQVVKYNDGLPVLGTPVWKMAFGGIIFSYVYKPSAADKRDIIDIIMLSNFVGKVPSKVLHRMNQTAEALTFVGHPDEEQVKTIFQRQYDEAVEALKTKVVPSIKHYSTAKA